MKHNLAGTSRDVHPYQMVLLDVKKAMLFLIWLELIERKLVEMGNLF